MSMKLLIGIVAIAVLSIGLGVWVARPPADEMRPESAALPPSESAPQKPRTVSSAKIRAKQRQAARAAAEKNRLIKGETPEEREDELLAILDRADHHDLRATTDRLIDEVDRTQRVEVLDALARIDPVLASEMAADLFGGRATAQERAEYLDMIAEVGSPNALDSLDRAVQDDSISPYERAQAALVMDELGDSSGISDMRDTMNEMMQSDDSKVQVKGTQIAAGLGEADVCRAGLSSLVQTVRLSSIRCLNNIGSLQDAETLKSLCDHSDVGTANQACRSGRQLESQFESDQGT